jgi:hypothetical protein
LIKQKDAVLTATQNIEELRKQYVQANKKDEDGTIESEIYKNIFIILSSLSELFAYTKNPGLSKILLTTTDWAGSRRQEEKSRFLKGNDGKEGCHIAESAALDAMCVTVNVVVLLEWRLKKEPLVNIQNLESLVQMKLPGAK